MLVVVLVVVMVGGARGNAILRQEFLQVHVLQLETIPIVGQGLVPQRGAQEGRLGGAVVLLQVLLLLLLFTEHYKMVRRRRKKDVSM